MLEIERKFLVKSDAFKEQAKSHRLIAQGYLNSDPERTVRIRISGESGFLTVKGKSDDSGTTRLEWETEMALHEARQLLHICEKGLIEKTRYFIPSGEFTFEVDEFHGENQGLVLAELELRSADQTFPKPDWLGEEVTGQIEYYNSHLSQNPYSTWQK